MDNQKKIFDELIFGTFPEKMASILYTGANKKDTIYKEGAYKVLEPREGKKIEHDAIIHFYQIGDWGGRQKVKMRDGIAIEIKTSAGDIWKTDVSKYLGATRLFFIAAPADLVPVIIMRYATHPKRVYIGIINSDSGDIVVLPKFQDIDRGRYNTLLAHCYTSSHRIPLLSDTEPYQMSRVNRWAQCAFDFILQNDLMVNTEYKYLFQSRKIEKI